MRLGLLDSVDLSEDLLVFRKAIRLLIRVGNLAVDEDLEDATRALAQRGGDAVLVLDGGLQTGGLRQVVSLAAIQNLDVHAAPFPDELALIV